MTDRTNLLTREDTLLGVCEGLGQETGIPPLVFRVAIALGLFWNPVLIVGGYLVVGVALMLFRWIAPFHRRAATPVATVPTPRGDNDDAVAGFSEAA